MKFLAILSILISLKTCNSTSKVVAFQHDNTINNSISIGGDYLVETLNNNRVSEHKLTLNFDQLNEQLSGFSGCNRFTGKYSLKGDSITIGPMASTKMFCGEVANQLEAEMHQVLSKTDKIIFSNEVLQFISNNNVVLTAAKKDDKISLNYSAISRGRYLDIILNDSIVSVTKSREAKPISKAMSSEDWKKLNVLLESINLDRISTLKSPTEARFYDGASIGTLKISKNGTVYESSSFDHGAPPQEIEVLVKEILSLAENVE